MEKQYSVKFFASFLEALQKVCRDFVDFDDSVELSGYLSLEIDNVKKERYVLSEMLNSSGNVISESYCTKAFKTVRKYQQPPSGRENITPRTHTVTNRSQRDQHHGFMSESQNPNSSPLFNFKDHSSESRIPKQWGQDMYGQNSQMSPLHGSGHQYGDSGGIHTMKSSNQKRSVPTILIDDLPSNKRVRSDSLPDDKLLTETISPPVKVDTASAMQMSFSDTSQSVAHLSSTTTTSSSLISSHTNNYTSSNTSTSQANSESIRLPLPVTIKDEPDIPCVDIDLSELDSVDSMGGGSDSGSGYPSADGTSGTYRMGGNVQGTPESYQTCRQQTFRRNRRQYSPVAMETAYLAVQEGKMTVSAAARKFGVPQPTLHARFKFGRGPGVLRRGRRPGCLMGSSFYKGMATMIQDQIPNVDNNDVCDAPVDTSMNVQSENDGAKCSDLVEELLPDGVTEYKPSLEMFN